MSPIVPMAQNTDTSTKEQGKKSSPGNFWNKIFYWKSKRASVEENKDWPSLTHKERTQYMFW